MATNGDVDALIREALKAEDAEAFEKLGAGHATSLGYPGGMAAERLLVVKLSKSADGGAARKAVDGLRQVGGNILGAVLNHVHWKGSEGYYYKYYE